MFKRALERFAAVRSAVMGPRVRPWIVPAVAVGQLAAAWAFASQVMLPAPMTYAQASKYSNAYLLGDDLRSLGGVLLWLVSLVLMAYLLAHRAARSAWVARMTHRLVSPRRAVIDPRRLPPSDTCGIMRGAGYCGARSVAAIPAAQGHLGLCGHHWDARQREQGAA